MSKSALPRVISIKKQPYKGNSMKFELVSHMNDHHLIPLLSPLSWRVKTKHLIAWGVDGARYPYLTPPLGDREYASTSALTSPQ
eukprot:5520849-Amphidinium_carterae.2